jgi:hypothetical protein
MDICIDRDGLIYVTDQALRLSVFTRDGTLVGRCRAGAMPHGVWVDNRRNVYLAELPDRVVKLERLAKNASS